MAEQVEQSSFTQLGRFRDRSALVVLVASSASASGAG